MSNYFPGPGTIINACNAAIVECLLLIVEHERPHVEVIPRSRSSSDKWTSVFDTFFERASGPGRAYDLWSTKKTGVKRLKASTLAAITHYSNRHDERRNRQEQLERIDTLAHELQDEINSATEVYERTVADRQSAREDRRQRLATADTLMGLNDQGRGQGTPGNLGFQIDSDMQQALDELGVNGGSPNRPAGTNRTNGTAVINNDTNSDGAGNGSASSTVSRAVNAPFRAALRDQQVQSATRGLVSPVLVPGGGHRARNPDQVDVLDQMNASLTTCMGGLQKIISNAGPSDMDKVRQAISGRIATIREKEANGLDASNDKRMLRKLEARLDELEMKELLGSD